MTRASDLAELGIEEGEVAVTEAVIRKAYLRQSKVKHPDKGGTKEEFQCLVNAYERLRAPSAHTVATEPREDDGLSTDEESVGSEYHEEYWYQEHFSFFGRTWEYGFDNDSDEEEDYFENWRKAKAKARAKLRREELKAGYDYRDQKAASGDEKCMFCGRNQPITELEAGRNGLNWEEYSAHPEGYKTCWLCKDTHVSVMTKNMARQRFAKKLDFTIPSKRTGVDYYPVFWFLKLDGKSFHHQPKPADFDGPTRNNEYYWYPDLETEALSHGWKPRGKKRDEVPWVPKDIASGGQMSLVAASKKEEVPSTPRKRKGKAHAVQSKVITPDKPKKQRRW